MSTGTQIALGVFIAFIVFGALLAARRREPRQTGPVTPELVDRLHGHLAAGKKVLAIKELREHTAMSLLDAKNYVEALHATGEPPAPTPVVDVRPETLARARELKAAGKVVHAVKAIRDETGWSLKECKDIVDSMPKGKKDDGFGYYSG